MNIAHINNERNNERVNMPPKKRLSSLEFFILDNLIIFGIAITSNTCPHEDTKTPIIAIAI